MIIIKLILYKPTSLETSHVRWQHFVQEQLTMACQKHTKKWETTAAAMELATLGDSCQANAKLERSIWRQDNQGLYWKKISYWCFKFSLCTTIECIAAIHFLKSLSLSQAWNLEIKEK